MVVIILFKIYTIHICISNDTGLVDMDQDENSAPIGGKDTGTSRQFDSCFSLKFQ